MSKGKATDYLVWKDDNGIHVECDNCGYQIPDDEPIPDICPKCGKSVDTISMSLMDAIWFMPSLGVLKDFKS